jgi:hypothetical protein
LRVNKSPRQPLGSASTFAVFDAFPDEAGGDAHLLGKVAKALMEKAPLAK